jgi:hypothetical protein
LYSQLFEKKPWSKALDQCRKSFFIFGPKQTGVLPSFKEKDTAGVDMEGVKKDLQKI